MHASNDSRSGMSPGYVSCAQLGDAIQSVGITMAPREVEMLATGGHCFVCQIILHLCVVNMSQCEVLYSVLFCEVLKFIAIVIAGFASDDERGISVQELQTLLYNLIGEHAARVAENRTLVYGFR